MPALLKYIVTLGLDCFRRRPLGLHSGADSLKGVLGNCDHLPAFLPESGVLGGGGSEGPVGLPSHLRVHGCDGGGLRLCVVGLAL